MGKELDFEAGLTIHEVAMKRRVHNPILLWPWKRAWQPAALTMTIPVEGTS